MPSVSSPSNGHLPRLNSPNIRTLDSIKTDKSHLLRSFIRSQEAHLSGYALEGKSVAASWDLDAVPARNKRTRDMELESGFGTPLLKPRAHARRLESVLNDRDKAAAGDGHGGSPVKKSKESVKPIRDKASSRKPTKENVSAMRERSEVGQDEEERASKRLRQSGIQEFAHPLPLPRGKAAVIKRAKPKEAQREMTGKKGRDVDADEEHEHRLAERRERRRAKKAVVDPKPAPPESESSDDSEPPNGKGTKKTAKKSKGLNIPAGLALMHGFSAKNIGKNRLTLNLDPAVGVFNKGKASAKTSVKKSKATKPYLHLFSEERFLSRAPKDSRRNANRRPSDSDDSDSETEETCLPPRTKPKRAASPESTSKRKRSRSPSQVSTVKSELAPDASQDGGSPAKKKRKPARAISPVWDIELETGQPLSDPASGGSVHSEEGTRLGGTVLLGTGAFTSKWVVPEKHHPPTESDIATPAVEPSLARQSKGSSIAPSHSASQVASCQDELGAAGGMQSEAFSRYFAVPPNTTHSSKVQPVSSRDYLQSPEAQLPSSSRDPVDPQSGVVDSTSGVRSQAQGHRWRSSLGDCLPAPAGQSDPVPHPGSMRTSSPNVLANLPFSPALHATSRSSSPFLPLGPCSPASPGHAGRDVDEVVPRSVPLDPVYVDVPGYVAAPIEQDAPEGEWTTHPLETFPVNDASPFLSDIHMHGDMASDHGYMQDEDAMVVEEHSYFGDSYTLEEQIPMSSPRVTASELEAIAYHHDSAYWEYNHNIKSAEEGHCDFVRSDGDLAEVAGYFAVDLEAGGADEDELRWPHDDAEDGEMEPNHTFCPGNPDDDYLPSEAGFASPGVALATGLESDDALESEPGDELSVLGALPRFSQGRALLMGVADTGSPCVYGGRAGVSSIEEDVAKSLRGHWLPQRF